MAAIDPSTADVTEENDGKHLELFSIVWLDDADDEKESRGTKQKLREIINHFKKFHDAQACEEYIAQRSTDERIMLIVNGRLGRVLVPSVHKLQQISSIYVYCMDREENNQWACDFNKVKRVVTELEELVAQIQENYKIQKKVGEPLSINTYSTTGVDGKFAFSQRLIDCLLRMRANEQDHIELIDLCMKEYEGNKNELARINQFQTSYSSNRAIWWYTRESFFYKTLNAALRTQAVHMMFLYRSFISDIYEQLRRYQSKTKLTVYRSQLISNDELETLKQNIGQLISVNSFFSSSRDRETAVFLFGDIGNPIVDSERVLFEIDADPRMADSKPFSDIGILSQFAEEAEVLFMFGSIFRVNSIEHENERVWVIRMTLCSDEEHDLQQILAHMKRQNGSGVTNLRTLGEILSTMGEFTLAEYYYSRFVDQLSSDDPQRVTLYEDLAKTASQKRNFDGSIKWQRKALEFKQLKEMIRIPSDARWAKHGITIAGGRRSGMELNQLASPAGTAVDSDGTVFIADCGNHRIVVWEKGNYSIGRVLAGGSGCGARMDQLDSPTDVLIDKQNGNLIICDRDNRRVIQWSRGNGTTNGETIIDNIRCHGLAMDGDGNLYVTDTEKHEVKRFRRGDTTATCVAGGNGEGDAFNQLSCPNYVFVDSENSVYISDFDNHRVMKWREGATEGIVVAGGRGDGEDLGQLSCPQSILVDAESTVYVAELGNQRVTRWKKNRKSGEIIVGGYGEGETAYQFRGPIGLSFDLHGHLYVTDWDNHRVQLFKIAETC